LTIEDAQAFKQFNIEHTPIKMLFAPYDKVMQMRAISAVAELLVHYSRISLRVQNI